MFRRKPSKEAENIQRARTEGEKHFTMAIGPEVPPLERIDITENTEAKGDENS